MFLGFFLFCCVCLCLFFFSFFSCPSVLVNVLCFSGFSSHCCFPCVFLFSFFFEICSYVVTRTAGLLRYKKTKQFYFWSFPFTCSSYCLSCLSLLVLFSFPCVFLSPLTIIFLFVFLFCFPLACLCPIWLALPRGQSNSAATPRLASPCGHSGTVSYPLHRTQLDDVAAARRRVLGLHRHRIEQYQLVTNDFWTA